jgi:arginase
MGISILTGRCWGTLARSIPGFEAVAGERIVLLGARDLEGAEVALLEELGGRRELGAPLGGEGVDLHFDLDVLDPSDAVWNQWAPPGGMSVEGVQDAVLQVRRAGPIRAVGIASYDPDADVDGRAGRAAAILEAVWGDIG